MKPKPTFNDTRLDTVNWEAVPIGDIYALIADYFGAYNATLTFEICAKSWLFYAASSLLLVNHAWVDRATHDTTNALVGLLCSIVVLLAPIVWLRHRAVKKTQHVADAVCNLTRKYPA